MTKTEGFHRFKGYCDSRVTETEELQRFKSYTDSRVTETQETFYMKEKTAKIFNMDLKHKMLSVRDEANYPRQTNGFSELYKQPCCLKCRLIDKTNTS